MLNAEKYFLNLFFANSSFKIASTLQFAIITDTSLGSFSSQGCTSKKLFYSGKLLHNRS